MNKEELHRKAIDNAANRTKGVDRRRFIAPSEYYFGLIQGFEDGAEWMLDNPTGGALLYAVEKTAERTKREIIEKASEFIYNTLFNWADGGDIDGNLTWNQLRDRYITKFKQAMSENYEKENYCGLNDIITCDVICVRRLRRKK